MTPLTLFNILLSLGLSFSSSLSVAFSTSKHRNIYPLFPITLCLMTVLRDRGWDYELYKEMYLSVTGLEAILKLTTSWVEPGFLIWIGTFRSLELPFWAFSASIAILTFSFLNSSIKWHGSNELLIIAIFFFLYFYRGPYGQIRQFFAMAIFLYSLRYLFEKKTIRYLCWNFFALSIHSTAIMTFAFLPFWWLGNNKKIFSLNLLLLLALTLSFFNSQELLVEALDCIRLHAMSYKLSYYINTNAISGCLFNLETLRILFVIVGINMLYTRTNSSNLHQLAIVYYFGVIVYLLLSFDLRIASRTSRAFLLTEIFLIPSLITLVNDKGYRFLLKLVVLISCIFYLTLEFFMMKNGTIIYG